MAIRSILLGFIVNVAALSAYAQTPPPPVSGADSLVAEAIAMRGMNDFEAADSLFTAALTLEPANPFAYYIYNFRAKTRMALARWDDAIEDFEKSIELNPKYSDSYLFRARYHKELKEYDKALKDYDLAIEYDSSNYVAYGESAAIFGIEQKYAIALERYEHAIRLAPEEDKPAYLELSGGTRFALQDFPGAVHDFTAVINSGKAKAVTYMMRGLSRSLLPTEDIDGACEDIRKAKALGMNVSDLKGLDEYCNKNQK